MRILKENVLKSFQPFRFVSAEYIYLHNKRKVNTFKKSKKKWFFFQERPAQKGLMKKNRNRFSN